MNEPLMLEKALRNHIHFLETTITQIQTENSEIKTEIIQVKNENLLLREQLSLAVYKRFCPIAEKFHPDQRDLFDCEPSAAEHRDTCGDVEKTEVRPYERKKAGRKAISPFLPRKEIIIDIAEEEKKCGCR